MNISFLFEKEITMVPQQDVLLITLHVYGRSLVPWINFIIIKRIFCTYGRAKTIRKVFFSYFNGDKVIFHYLKFYFIPEGKN